MENNVFNKSVEAYNIGIYLNNIRRKLYRDGHLDAEDIANIESLKLNLMHKKSMGILKKQENFSENDKVYLESIISLLNETSSKSEEKLDREEMAISYFEENKDLINMDSLQSDISPFDDFNERLIKQEMVILCSKINHCLINAQNEASRQNLTNYYDQYMELSKRR